MLEAEAVELLAGCKSLAAKLIRFDYDYVSKTFDNKEHAQVVALVRLQDEGYINFKQEVEECDHHHLYQLAQDAGLSAEETERIEGYLIYRQEHSMEQVDKWSQIIAAIVGVLVFIVLVAAIFILDIPVGKTTGSINRVHNPDLITYILTFMVSIPAYGAYYLTHWILDFFRRRNHLR